MGIAILFNAEGLVPTILHNMIINAIIRATESNCVYPLCLHNSFVRSKSDV
jgi:hypothetical protein